MTPVDPTVPVQATWAPGFWWVCMEDGSQGVVRLDDGGEVYLPGTESPCPPSRVQFVQWLGDEKGRA